jgi:large subunit ribosomal protein L10
VEGLVLTAAQIKALADLPSRPRLLAAVLGSMAAPLTSLAGVLTGLPRNLVYALDQVRKRQEQAAA